MIHGTYRAGHIELDECVDWIDGIRVAVTPANDAVGLRETDGPRHDTALASLLSRIDALEPLELTATEETDVAEFQRAVRDTSRNTVRQQMESAE